MLNFSQKITFNGKQYSNIEQMPERDREVFEKLAHFFADKNNNMVADRFEASGTFEIGKCTISTQITDGTQEILINGRSYSSPEAMSDEDRRIYQGALALLDRNNNGVPDAFEVLSEREIQNAFGKPVRAKNVATGSDSGVWKALTIAALCTVLYMILSIWG